MLRITIAPDVAATYPEVFAIALSTTGIDPSRAESLAGHRINSACGNLRRTIDEGAAISDLPHIARWREAYRCAGVKPSKFHASIEALIRRALKGTLSPVLPLVDLYNAVSLAHHVPLGAADLDLLPAPEIRLRFLRPGEDSFAPLGATADQFPMLPSVPVYASGRTVLCWCFNCRDSKETALTPETRNAVFVSEGVCAEQVSQALAALEALAHDLRLAGAATEIRRFEIAAA